MRDVDVRLIDAANKGQAGRVEQLLRTGANPDVRGYGGFTPMMYAVFTQARKWKKGDCNSVVRVLLKWKAQVNLRNENGDTALGLAASKALGHTDPRMVQILINAGGKE